MGKSRGKRKKKTQTHVEVEESNVPKTMIFRRGKVGQSVRALEMDLRRVLAPHTAEKLRERKNNTLKDFLNVAPTIGVTHFLALGQTSIGVNLRLIRVPRGPTLSFRINQYSLMKDVVNMQKRPYLFGPKEKKLSPLVVMNSFSADENHMKLLTAMWQSVFPPLDVNEMKLSEARRVVLLDYDAKNDEISFRHYLITCGPIGINKNIKRIIKARIPNLSNLTDISEALDQAVLSDSEAEDVEGSNVTLSENYRGRGNRASHKSAIRLKELGPRMTLQLLKIEAGVGTGEVLYNKLQTKTEDEKAALKARKRREKEDKARRIKEQETNVKRKNAKSDILNYANEEEVEDDDDAEWYRTEVGEEPDEDMFASNDAKSERSRTSEVGEEGAKTGRGSHKKKRKAPETSGGSEGGRKTKKLKKKKR